MISVETQTAFETDLDKIQKASEAAKIQGVDKTAGEILLGFLDFYSNEFIKSSRDKNLIINISADIGNFKTVQNDFDKVFDKDYFSSEECNDRQYIIRDPFNNTYNPAKVTKTGVNYR